MTRAELYKLRTHRTPLITSLVLLLGVLTPSVVLIWYSPQTPAAYGTAFTATYGILATLLAVVFGGWLLGTEYRQDTVKRFLTTEPRRLRALGTKAAVGGGALAVALAATAAIGWTAARVVGSMNDVTVAWNGRELLAATVTALVAAAVAFGLSALTRSDSFAMVGTVAMLLVLDPLLTLIPKIGKYSFGSALGVITDEIEGAASAVGPFAEPAALSTGTATMTIAAWMVVLVGTGVALFAHRDV